jgi:hypothetical protein
MLRLANPDEVESIRAMSDLEPPCVVMAEDTPDGTHLAVARFCLEVDPVFFAPESKAKGKVLFMQSVEGYLHALGNLAYYFNINADVINERWRDVVKAFGAEQVSPVPELRFKKILKATDVNQAELKYSSNVQSGGSAVVQSTAAGHSEQPA